MFGFLTHYRPLKHLVQVHVGFRFVIKTLSFHNSFTITIAVHNENMTHPNNHPNKRTTISLANTVRLYETLYGMSLDVCEAVVGPNKSTHIIVITFKRKRKIY